MTTLDQYERAVEETKKSVESILGTSFKDPKEAYERISALLAGEGEEVELPDHVLAAYCLQYEEFADEAQFGAEANPEIQAKAISQVLAEPDIAGQFGESINQHTDFSDKDVDELANIFEADLKAQNELEIESPQERTISEEEAVQAFYHENTDDLTGRIEKTFDAAVLPEREVTQADYGELDEITDSLER